MNARGKVRVKYPGFSQTLLGIERCRGFGVKGTIYYNRTQVQDPGLDDAYFNYSHVYGFSTQTAPKSAYFVIMHSTLYSEAPVHAPLDQPKVKYLNLSDTRPPQHF